jgi:hypothetical protein
VREVDLRPGGDARHDRRRTIDAEAVPPHVGNFDGAGAIAFVRGGPAEALARPRQKTQAGAIGRFFAAREQPLQA